MSLTTSQATALFRKMGIANPLEAACGQPPTEKHHKYNARKKSVDNIVFDSAAEAKAYIRLKAMQHAGEISDLAMQPRFLLQDGFRDRTGKWHRKIEYVADFKYLRCQPDHLRDTTVVVDVKGMRLPQYLLKLKLFRAKYPWIYFQEWK